MDSRRLKMARLYGSQRGVRQGKRRSCFSAVRELTDGFFDADQLLGEARQGFTHLLDDFGRGLGDEALVSELALVPGNEAAKLFGFFSLPRKLGLSVDDSFKRDKAIG